MTEYELQGRPDVDLQKDVQQTIETIYINRNFEKDLRDDKSNFDNSIQIDTKKLYKKKNFKTKRFNSRYGSNSNSFDEETEVAVDVQLRGKNNDKSIDIQSSNSEYEGGDPSQPDQPDSAKQVPNLERRGTFGSIEQFQGKNAQSFMNSPQGTGQLEIQKYGTLGTPGNKTGQIVTAIDLAEPDFNANSTFG